MIRKNLQLGVIIETMDKQHMVMCYDYRKKMLMFPGIMFHGWIWDNPKKDLVLKLNSFLGTKLLVQDLSLIWSNKSKKLYRFNQTGLTNGRIFKQEELQRYSAGWYYRSTVENYNRTNISPESLMFLDVMIKYFAKL